MELSFGFVRSGSEYGYEKEDETKREKGRWAELSL